MQSGSRGGGRGVGFLSSRRETLLTANELINLDHQQQQARQDVKNNFLCTPFKINHMYFINHKSKPKTQTLLVVQVSSGRESSRLVVRSAAQSKAASIRGGSERRVGRIRLCFL